MPRRVEEKRGPTVKRGDIYQVRGVAGSCKVSQERKESGGDSEKRSRGWSLYHAGLRFRDIQGREKGTTQVARNWRFPVVKRGSTVSRRSITEKEGVRRSGKVTTARRREDRNVQSSRKDTASFQFAIPTYAASISSSSPIAYSAPCKRLVDSGRAIGIGYPITFFSFSLSARPSFAPMLARRLSLRPLGLGELVVGAAKDEGGPACRSA